MSCSGSKVWKVIVRLQDCCKGEVYGNVYKVCRTPTHTTYHTDTTYHTHTTYHTYTTHHTQIHTQKHREKQLCTLCVANIPGHVSSSEFEDRWLVGRWLSGRVTGGVSGVHLSLSLSLSPSLPPSLSHKVCTPLPNTRWSPMAIYERQ